MRRYLLTTATCFGLIFGLFAQNQNDIPLDSVQPLDEIVIKANTILGNKYVAQNRTGASYYLSNQELEQFGVVDINRALRTVPGVNFYEEDGFGLRPNISLRGTSPQRSSKITLMEDGVLIAPAPYSAPAAYYFPSVARMEAVEILKGSSQVQYGPFTTGGAINLVSTPIPEKMMASVRSSYGSFNTGQLHAKTGNQVGRVGYLLEYLNYNSDGFKELRNNENTGFDINEVVGKLSVSFGEQIRLPQTLEFKFHYYDERSNETYLGLTEADFDATPYLRYAGSQVDNMDADHTQFMLTHSFNFSDRFSITTNLYNNRFSRNWYKLDDVVFNGDKRGISSVVSDPMAFSDHFSIVTGASDSGADALLVKANNRVYYSRGIQTKFDYHWYGSNGVFHDLEIGARLHYDEEDRFQWEDGYSMISGNMARTSDGPRGAQGNRISDANAFASYVLYKYSFKGLTITPGVRFESITLGREDFGRDDPNRTGIERSTRENSVNVWIPGVGFNYKFSRNMMVFGGVHKGFSPPSNAPGEKAEESINYELGTRFGTGRLRGELIGFYNDYSNLLGSDLAASGGTGSLDQFNAGEVRVSGMEVLLNYDLLPEDKAVKVPVSATYTLTNAIFQSDFGSNEDIWGAVSDGDRVPYIPRHQFNFAASLIHKKYEFNVNARYSGAFGTQAGNGDPNNTEELASNFVVDLSAKYHFNSKLSLTANVVNLLDEVYAASRVPAGFRPGHPFGVYGGLNFNL